MDYDKQHTEAVEAREESEKASLVEDDKRQSAIAEAKASNTKGEVDQLKEDPETRSDEINDAEAKLSDEQDKAKMKADDAEASNEELETQKVNRQNEDAELEELEKKRERNEISKGVLQEGDVRSNASVNEEAAEEEQLENKIKEIDDQGDQLMVDSTNELVNDQEAAFSELRNRQAEEMQERVDAGANTQELLDLENMHGAQREALANQQIEAIEDQLSALAIDTEGQIPEDAMRAMTDRLEQLGDILGEEAQQSVERETIGQTAEFLEGQSAEFDALKAQHAAEFEQLLDSGEDVGPDQLRGLADRHGAEIEALATEQLAAVEDQISDMAVSSDGNIPEQAMEMMSERLVELSDTLDEVNGNAQETGAPEQVNEADGPDVSENVDEVGGPEQNSSEQVNEADGPDVSQNADEVGGPEQDSEEVGGAGEEGESLAAAAKRPKFFAGARKFAQQTFNETSGAIVNWLIGASEKAASMGGGRSSANVQEDAGDDQQQPENSTEQNPTDDNTPPGVDSQGQPSLDDVVARQVDEIMNGVDLSGLDGPEGVVELDNGISVTRGEDNSVTITHTGVNSDGVEMTESISGIHIDDREFMQQIIDSMAQSDFDSVNMSDADSVSPPPRVEANTNSRELVEAGRT